MLKKYFKLIDQLPKFLVLKIIFCYKYFISPLLGNNCRFYPSCSEYMKICIERFGVIVGILLGIKRICRCNPFFESGIDEPPAIKNKKG